MINQRSMYSTKGYRPDIKYKENENHKNLFSMLTGFHYQLNCNQVAILTTQCTQLFLVKMFTQMTETYRVLSVHTLTHEIILVVPIHSTMPNNLIKKKNTRKMNSWDEMQHQFPRKCIFPLFLDFSNNICVTL